MPQSGSFRGSTRRYPRKARLDKVLLEVVADTLERSDDDRLSLVTITGLSVDPDLRHAVVFYTTRSHENTEPIEEALEEARVPVQSAIGRETRLKRTPQLRFERDPGMDHGWKIEAILKQERERRDG